MLNFILDAFGPALGDAIFALLQAAVRGGLLVSGVFWGKLLSTGFTEHPSIRRIISVAMPIQVVIALFFSLYGFWLVVNPGESQREAVRDAVFTFLVVLIPLWSGSVWAASELKRGSDCKG